MRVCRNIYYILLPSKKKKTNENKIENTCLTVGSLRKCIPSPGTPLYTYVSNFSQCKPCIRCDRSQLAQDIYATMRIR